MHIHMFINRIVEEKDTKILAVVIFGWCEIVKVRSSETFYVHFSPYLLLIKSMDYFNNILKIIYQSKIDRERGVRGFIQALNKLGPSFPKHFSVRILFWKL